MKLLQRLGFASEKKAASLTSPEALALFGVPSTITGLQIGPGTAMRVPAVACAVGLIAETVGTLPVKLFAREGRGAMTEHPAYHLAHDEATEWVSAEAFRTQITADALLTGNGYAWVNRSSDGTPMEMHRLAPGTVMMDQPDTIQPPTYRVQHTSGQGVYDFRDILHVSALGGVSPVTLCREAIGLAAAYEGYVAKLFANGARPSGIVRTPKTMTAEAKKNFMAQWYAQLSASREGGVAVLDEGAEYDALTMTLTDSQFAENRLEQINEIARAFRVPPTMLFELSRGTWSNTEEMSRQFLQVTLKPWLAQWAAAYSRCLLTLDERREAYFEFITDDLLTTTHAEQAEAFAKYRSMGVMTGNEVRAARNMQPLPDGDTLTNPYTTTSTEPTAPAQTAPEVQTEETPA